MNYPDLKSLQDALLSEKVTSLQIVDYYLGQIKNTNHLNIYVEVYDAEAREKAKQLDEKISKFPNDLGLLFGLIVSIKDVLCYADHEVTAGSKILSGFKSNYSATAIKKLIDEDAIIIGRTNCDEFAMGSSNENSFYGPTINGKGTNRIPGGSSGASAVSVQMNTCMVAIGSDTGGSVRQPAGFCGVIGMKPSYGRISRYGLIAYASSFDQIGILGNTIVDIAITLQCIAGEDENDSTSSKLPVPDYLNEIQLPDKPKNIAIFKVALEEKGLQREIHDSTNAFIEQLKQDGHQVNEMEFDLLHMAVPAYYVLTTAEASSNLARYDGIRYGYRSPNASNIREVYSKSRTEGFGEEVKRRIMLGTFVLSAGYYDAYYGKAQKVRRLLLDQLTDTFQQNDFIVLPIAPTTAWTIGSKMEDPIEVYLSDIFTVLANLSGIPAISIPIGEDNEGMPIGIQLMSQKFSEEKLLAFAHNILKTNILDSIY